MDYGSDMVQTYREDRKEQKTMASTEDDSNVGTGGGGEGAGEAGGVGQKKTDEGRGLLCQSLADLTDPKKKVKKHLIE